MSDSYHSIGARQDRVNTWSLLERIAAALERIADYYEGDLEYTKLLTGDHSAEYHEELERLTGATCPACRVFKVAD